MCAKKKPAMLEPDMQDAVIYTRYSSHNQRDCSIEQQVADCEIFARQNNLRVVTPIGICLALQITAPSSSKC